MWVVCPFLQYTARGQIAVKAHYCWLESLELDNEEGEWQKSLDQESEASRGDAQDGDVVGK